jgi:hypothetical protein
MPNLDTRIRRIDSEESGPFSLRRASLTSIYVRARAYFASDARRAIQTVLGLIWLLDGVLQFQSFMYSNGFVHMISSGAAGQPEWLSSTIKWAAHILHSNLTFLNTLSALTQVIIGVGLLCRPAVKAALALSFAWSLVVWWIGEALGNLFAVTANPLTGAPGAVLLYAVIGLLAWPTDRRGGLLGERGARTTWAALWLVMAWLWLLAPNSASHSTSAAITAAPSGAKWLTSLQHSVASAAAGNGVPIALLLAVASAAIGVGVAVNRRPRAFLALAVVLNLAYWVVGQGLGGVLTGSATDPNAGPLFILFAFAMYALVNVAGPAVQVADHQHIGAATLEQAKRAA